MPEALVLGAGQEVGRSCVVVTVGGKRIMFDCGMISKYTDSRRFPNFSALAGPGGDLSHCVDALVITHYHLDHTGALPHLTEICGYRGPIFMSAPSRAIVNVLLQDYRRVMENKTAPDMYSESDISRCLSRVRILSLGELVHLGPLDDSPNSSLKLRTYYAGHVLGAVMAHVECAGESVLYTGDFNATPDRYLGAAAVPNPPLRPDLLISESTYAATVRGFKRRNEREFATRVHEAVQGGGKVLIPVYAFGRAQELQVECPCTPPTLTQT